jgi:hypothetical protein
MPHCLLQNTAMIAKKRKLRASFPGCGAGEESRTLDLNLGKVALYQLSYSRMSRSILRRCESRNYKGKKGRLEAGLQLLQ